jgi:phytoene dehydrogenase-like protein
MPNTSDIYDIVIVGGGHNGLVCAAYLARAGKSVRVLERRPIVGGAVCTEEIVPGYKFDVGSSAHIMIHATPILSELRLDRFGLEYIDMDPWAFHPILGRDQSISFYRDVDRTCASIARISPEDADRYANFVRHWGELNEGVFEVFMNPPDPQQILWTIIKRNITSYQSRKVWTALDSTRQLMAPYGQVINETFTNPHVRTALLWLAAQSGPGPNEVASGDMFGWNALIHKIGAKRAKGGSGALTQALARCVAAHGGEIQLNAEVSAIARTPQGEFATRLADGDIVRSRRVVGACHVKTFFLDLLQDCPAELRRRVANIRVGNGFGMIVRHAVDALPQYPGVASDARGVAECHGALQLLCPSAEHLNDSFQDFTFGRAPQNPSVVAMTFSAIDPDLCPPGKHLLFTWGQYHPYELTSGERWDDIAEREADKLYDLVCRYAPNMRGKLIDRYIQTPVEIERRLGLLRANVMHVEMSLDQMFMFRPLPELASYRTPIPGLYLTGASMHPGGGVFGASGYNTARVILKDGR